MFRAAEVSVGPPPFCRLLYGENILEERSSEEYLGNSKHKLKPMTAASRSLGAAPSTCRGTSSRNASASCAPWIPTFLAASYFQPCERHRHHKKNECTFFCITCGFDPESVCQHCMGSHAGHEVIQVRRYVYCDVVRTCDINPYMDTTGVQNYIINSAKVMFLNPRSHSKVGRVNGVDVCRSCQRHLREGFSYCSLACKVAALMEGETLLPTTTAAGSGSTHTTAAAVAVTPLSAARIPMKGGVSDIGPSSSASCRFHDLLLSDSVASMFAAAWDATNSSRHPSCPLNPTTGAAASVSAFAAAAAVAATAAPSPLPTPRSAGARVARFSAPTGGAAAAAAPGGGIIGAVNSSSESAAATAGAVGLSSDPESSESGEDAVLYGNGAVHTAQKHSALDGLDYDGLYGSALSEEECCGREYEPLPKRRRPSLISHHRSNGSCDRDSRPLPHHPAAATAAAPSIRESPAVAAAAAAGARDAASSLLMPFRTASSPAASSPDLNALVLGSSLGLSWGLSHSRRLGSHTSSVLSGLLPEAPAPVNPAAYDAGGGKGSSGGSGLHSAVSLPMFGMSRRKQTAPQRAPSC